MYLNSVGLTLILLLGCTLPCIAGNGGKQKSAVIDDITEIKDFKQLLRTKTNILVCFVSKSSSENANILKAFKEAALIIKGHGTMVHVECNGAAKKMCKKLKVDKNIPVSFKHYKDGDFNKNYDRRESTSSIVNFMRDPTGSLPWDEDPTATDVIHLPDADSIVRFLKKGPTLMKPSMIMFYAPWCGYCKILKPEYSGAAADLKGEAYLAAIDVARPENSVIRNLYNISGFPTMLYYENGQMKYQYEGENTRTALVNFMRFPRPNQKAVKNEEPEEEWSLADNNVVHLTSDTFDSTLADKSALVMFYAPWCGHCKRIKPDYERAATIINKDNETPILAAVDATKESDIGSRYDVKGYPTMKFFVNGEFKFDVSARDEESIIKFMQDPQPPPPPEPQWVDQVTDIVHLEQGIFKNTLKKKKHALIMFYAPWCGHCKNIKPEFNTLAQAFKEDSRTVIGAVDCTREQALCQEYGVTSYPTIKYFSFFDRIVKIYNGGRNEEDFTAFLKNPMSVESSHQETKEQLDSLQLTDSNFEREISHKYPTLVMFYAPWCGFCKKMKPAFEKAAQLLKSENYPARLAMLDCTVHAGTASTYDIRSYPSLKLFMNGKFVEEYNGDREGKDLVDYIKKVKADLKVEL